MAAPLMSRASTAAAGSTSESPPVSGSFFLSGIVLSMTPSLGEVVVPSVVVPSVVVPSVVVAEVLVPLVSPVVVPVVVPVVPVVPVVVPVGVPVVVPVVVVPVVVVPVVVVVVVVSPSSGRQNVTWVMSKPCGCPMLPPVMGPMGSSAIRPDLITRMTGSDEVKSTPEKATVPEIVTVVLSTVTSSSNSLPA